MHLLSPLSDPKLNPKQKEAVLAISAPLAVILPPILIIGRPATISQPSETKLYEVSWLKLVIDRLFLSFCLNL